MRWLQLLIVLIGVGLVTAPMAEQTAKLRGPKEFDTPAVNRLGPLSAHDTLWRLAAQVRPDPRVNIYQVMFALYQKNPDSFLDDNFNHLKPGAYLDVPNLREIMAIDASEAQRKSENDDREWAEKIRLAAQIKPEDHSAKQKDLEAAKAEISDELERLQSEQSEQLGDLRDKLSASMSNVESIVKENGELKTQLDTVVGQLGSVKQQLDKDSEIQQQLQQLLAQQQEMLAKQTEQIKKAEEESFGNIVQKFANSPAGWVMAAAFPAIVLLLVFVSIMRRKGQKAAAVVSAATAAPLTDPNYKSPLPPIDDSLDFDETSLINLDDSLLNDRKGGGIRLDDDFDMPAAKSVSSSFGADDLLDDSLDLPDEPMLPTSKAKNSDELDLDDLLDEPFDTSSTAKTEFDANNILSGDDLSALFSEADSSFVAKQEFDPNNILSGNELSSLFENLADDDDLPLEAAPANTPLTTSSIDDEEDEEVDIDALLSQNTPTEQAIATAASELVAADELLEEIELELPSDSPVPLEVDDEFDIDALVNANQPDLSVTTADDADDDVTDIDALLAANSAPSTDTASEALATAFAPTDKAPTDNMAEDAFDPTDLDAFAESLADEMLQAQPSELVEELQDDDLELDVLDDDSADSNSELDAILSEVAELRAQSAAAQQQLPEQIPAQAWQEAAEDFAQAPISLTDVNQMLQEDDVEIALPAQVDDHEDILLDSWSEPSADDDNIDSLIEEMTAHIEASAKNESEATSLEVLENEVFSANAAQADDTARDDAIEAELAEHADAETEYLTEFAELEAHLEMPDLAVEEALDDLPASRAQLAVENPSRVLDAYPELDLEDVELDSIFPDELVDDNEPLDAFALEQDSTGELTELDASDFDALLADLVDVPEDVLQQQDAQSTAKALEDLASLPELNDDDNETVEDGALLPDYVQIDKLLAAAEDHQVVDDSKPLNVDVGLSEFEDLIAADEHGDVDLQDNGYASRLDLVRAYIEIGDQESADQLIHELLASDAPEHVKAEAKSLSSV